MSEVITESGSTVEYWVHDLSPFLIQFTDSFGLRWYSLAYIIGIIWAAWLIYRWAKAARSPFYPSEVQDFALAVGIGMIVGGRIGYMLFYYQGDLDLAAILSVHKGGMASHGGIVGIFLGTWYFAWRRGRSLWACGDAVSAAAPIGVILGRLANFINGELWGRKTDVSWGVIFPDSYAYKLPEGMQKYSDEWYTLMQAAVDPRHPSQLYAACLEGLVVFIVGTFVHKRHRRPGITSAAVLITYALVRFIGEFWREPDTGYELYFGWMSKGQALSLPILAAAIALLVWSYRRGANSEAYLRPESDPQLKESTKNKYR